MTRDHTAQGDGRNTVHKRAMLTFGIAAALTLLVAPMMNSVEVGSSGGADFLGDFGVTVCINEYLGIGGGYGNSLDATPEDYADPQIARFLSTVKARLQPYLGKPGSNYHAWMIVPKYPAQGSPYKTRVTCAEVVLAEYTDGSLQDHVLLADRNGEPPERPDGRLGNWLFYAAMSMPMAWLLVASFSYAVSDHNSATTPSQTEGEP